MLNVLWIALGGAIGSVMRYSMSVWLPISAQMFPKATFLTNILASFLVGLVSGVVLLKFPESTWLKYFLLIGFCGGFSTFSTYAMELFQLGTDGKIVLAAVYAISTIVLSILAIALGVWCSKILS